jgi:hypothetical protein
VSTPLISWARCATGLASGAPRSVMNELSGVRKSLSASRTACGRLRGRFTASSACGSRAAPSAGTRKSLGRAGRAASSSVRRLATSDDSSKKVTLPEIGSV